MVIQRGIVPPMSFRGVPHLREANGGRRDPARGASCGKRDTPVRGIEQGKAQSVDNVYRSGKKKSRSGGVTNVAVIQCKQRITVADSVGKVPNLLRIGINIYLSGVVLALRDRVCDVPNAEVPMPASQGGTSIKSVVTFSKAASTSPLCTAWQ